MPKILNPMELIFEAPIRDEDVEALCERTPSKSIPSSCFAAPIRLKHGVYADKDPEYSDEDSEHADEDSEHADEDSEYLDEDSECLDEDSVYADEDSESDEHEDFDSNEAEGMD